ncbi:ABC transporter permease [Cypionkella sinensis]|uniref:ABC transporter permease n=1 Tax=Cypionkella sinensis TaxID=1756043 RepID=A0ABV7IXS0_9RHOB
MAQGFPEIFDVRALGRAIDTGFNQIVADYGATLEAIFLPILKLLLAMEKILQWLPWWVVILVLAALAYAASRRWGIALAVAVMTFAIGLIGVWDAAMATIALMVVATLLAVVVGLPIGVAMSRSKRMQSITLPVLDVMQTMPIFVYLIPFVMLFGPGKIPALLATIVFAIPPVIRLTNLGIRGVDPEIVEATRAFGASPAQILLSVQIPLALPTILAGINQTTMMALSMVVIASMIGAGGLGYQVLQGIQRLQISSGLMAGLGIVLLAIIFDRIAQSYGKRMQKSLKLDH